MCYTATVLNTKDQKETPHKCWDCGADLILVEEVTMTLGNNLYPTTKSTYRCSNKDCQDEADRKAVKRAELKKEQELSRAKRIQENLKLKR